MYHEENFEKVTYAIYGELIWTLDVYSYIIMSLKFPIYKHNYIVRVEGSSIVLHIECLEAMFHRYFF